MAGRHTIELFLSGGQQDKPQQFSFVFPSCISACNFVSLTELNTLIFFLTYFCDLLRLMFEFYIHPPPLCHWNLRVIINLHVHMQSKLISILLCDRVWSEVSRRSSSWSQSRKPTLPVRALGKCIPPYSPLQKAGLENISTTGILWFKAYRLASYGFICL